MIFRALRKRRSKRRRQDRYQDRFQTNLVLTKLESRRVLTVAANLAGTALTIDLGPNDDDVTITHSGGFINVTDIDGTTSFATANVDRINVFDTGGNDRLTLQDSVSLAGVGGVSLLVDAVESIDLLGAYSLSQGFVLDGGGIDDGGLGSLNIGGLMSTDIGTHEILLNGSHDFSLVSVASAANVEINDVNDITIDRLVADQASISTAISIFDSIGALIQVSGDASFSSDTIILADSPGDSTTVQDQMFFSVSDLLIVGTAGLTGSSVNFGSLGLLGGDAFVFESDDIHLDGVSVNELSLSTANQITQSGTDTGSSIGHIEVLDDALFLLRSGDGDLYLSRTSSAPGAGGVDDGTQVLANDFANAITIAGIDSASLGVGSNSDISISNANVMASFPVFAGKTLGDGLLLHRFEWWQANQSIVFPRYQWDVRGDLILGAGVTESAGSYVLAGTSQSITDESGINVSVVGDMQLLAAGDITMSNSLNDVYQVNGIAVLRSLNSGDVQLGAGSIFLPRLGSVSAQGAAVEINEGDATHIDGAGIRANTFTLNTHGDISQAPNAIVDAAIDAFFNIDVTSGTVVHVDLFEDNDIAATQFSIINGNSIGDLRFKNIHSAANTTDLPIPATLDNLSIWFPNASVALDAPLIVNGDLLAISGLDGSSASNLTSISSASAAVSDTATFQLTADAARIVSASDLTLADDSSNRVTVTDTLQLESALGNINLGVIPVSPPLDPNRGTISGAIVDAGQLNWFAQNGHVTMKEDSSTEFSGTNQAETLKHIAGGDITDDASTTTRIDGDANASFAILIANNGGNSANVILGDGNSVLEFDHLSRNSNHFLGLDANHVSLQVDTGVNLRHEGADVPFQIDGTLFVSANGIIEQVDDELTVNNLHGSITAEQAAFVADALIIPKANIESVAIDVGTNVDIENYANFIPADLPRSTNTGTGNANIIDPAIGNPLNPFDANSQGNGFVSSLVPLQVDNSYGAYLLNRQVLQIATVADAVGPQASLDGIVSSDGHVYVQTVSGDLEFVSIGNQPIVDIANQRVFTAVAADDVVISQNATTLQSSTGTVTGVGRYPSFDERFFTPFGAISIKEGAFVQITPPSISPPIFTTRVIGADRTQDIRLNVGRGSETNFTVALVWADGFDPNGVPDTSDEIETFELFRLVTSQNTFDISHTFTPGFFNSNPYGTDYPTSVYGFNDPLINLYGSGGQRNLNQTTVVMGFPDRRLNQNLPGTNTDFSGSLILARAQDVLPTPELLPQNNPPIIFAPLSIPDFPVRSSFTFQQIRIEESRPPILITAMAVQFGRIDENGEWIEKPESWPQGPTGDYIQEIKEHIQQGDQYPPGKYEIWTVFNNGLIEKVQHTKQFENPPEDTLNMNSDLDDGKIVRANEDADADSVDSNRKIHDREWIAAWQFWAESKPDDSVQHAGSSMIRFSQDAAQ